MFDLAIWMLMYGLWFLGALLLSVGLAGLVLSMTVWRGK